MEWWIVAAGVFIVLGIAGAGMKEDELERRIKELEEKVEVLGRSRR